MNAKGAKLPWRIDRLDWLQVEPLCGAQSLHRQVRDAAGTSEQRDRRGRSAIGVRLERDEMFSRWAVIPSHKEDMKFSSTC